MSTPGREPPELDGEPGLGIGELARATGLTQQVIRAWEARFDFPVPVRTPTGHRRYHARDVERIARVLALKRSGTRLGHAIDRVRQEETDGRLLSIYAELRRQHPQIAGRVLRRDVLVALSHAIEDESFARAQRPLVFGCFQREEFFRRAESRWREIDRTATACVVFADFSGDHRQHGQGPIEVPLDPESPLLREWAVVCQSSDFSAVLTAWQLPGQAGRPLAERRFETLVSLDPRAVHTAVEVCLATAQSAGVRDTVRMRDAQAALDGSPPAITGIDALFARALDYVQHLADPNGASR